jgi:Immunity protein Imm1
MMRVQWFDPRSEQIVKTEATTAEDVLKVIDETGHITSGCGRPSVEVVRDDGAVLAVAGDGVRSYVCWIDSLGDSYSSVGGSFTDLLVFDHFGSWSEVPGEALITPEQAADCVRAFMTKGHPTTEAVLFTPD